MVPPVQASESVSVVICTYTPARWDSLRAAVESVERQMYAAAEVVLVIDHHAGLWERATEAFPEAIVVENRYAQGLSGARNSGIEASRGGIVAFLDDDAMADEDWLASLVSCYASPEVLGAGGSATPVWLGVKPGWFPDEFGWVVGCTYRGQPEQTAPVRNLLGCNMSFRREVFDAVGGFENGLGRVGEVPVGCEETELCIRARNHWPSGVILYEPAARVYHRVPASRGTWGYFSSRCYAEGKSKALVTQLVGQQSGLASERTYTLRTLPSGMAWGLAEAAFRMRPVGAARTGAIAAGFALTVAGYLRGRMSQGRERAGGGQESKRDDSPGGGPVRILNVELGSGDAVLGASAGDAGDNATRAITLVSLHGQPLGVVDHPSVRDISSPDDHWRAIQDELAGEIAAHLERDGVALPEPLEVSAISALEPCSLGEPEATEGITVVVATHDRPGMLARCLESLLFQDYPDFRIVVADNAPASDASERLVRQCYSDTGKVEYVRSNVPGLAIAHNSGMGLVGTPLVAFTDDDVTVDHRWLVAINRAFQRDRRIACVTGLIFPAELETPAQLWAEEYWGYKKGFRGRLFNLGPDRVDTPIYPYTAGMFGSGANMAFRTGALREMGGFDPALGAGTKAKGGDDLSAFFETVKRGYTIAYEPAAIVFHPHHREYESMLKQAYGYGAGLTAYLTKLVFDRPWLLLDMARKAPAAAAYLLGPKSAKNLRRPAGLPRELFAVERRGMLHGAWLYAVSRWQTRRLRRRGYA